MSTPASGWRSMVVCPLGTDVSDAISTALSALSDDENTWIETRSRKSKVPDGELCGVAENDIAFRLADFAGPVSCACDWPCTSTTSGFSGRKLGSMMPSGLPSMVDSEIDWVTSTGRLPQPAASANRTQASERDIFRLLTRCLFIE